MVDPGEGWDLPSRSTLDAWVVPEPAIDLPERIVDAWQGAPRERPARTRTRSTRTFVVGALVGALAAAIVMMILRPHGEPNASTQEPAAIEVSGVPDRAEVTLVIDVDPDDAHVHVSAGGRTVAELEGDARIVVPRDEAPKPAARPVRRAEPSDGGLKNPFRDGDPKQTATLRLGTNKGARPAVIYIDGKRIGTTPVMNHEIVPGLHRIEWRWDDGRIVSEHVTIAAGEARTLKRG